MTEKNEVPSRASIVFGMAATGAALIATAYIGAGLWSMREVVGFVLGLVVSVLFFAQTLSRIIERGSAGVDRALKQAEVVDYPPFVPAVRPDQTVRIYRESECPTEILRINGRHWG